MKKDNKNNRRQQMKKLLIFIALTVCLLITASTVFAANDLNTGLLISGSGLTGTSSWAGSMSFSWNVSLLNNVYTYTYVLSDVDTSQQKNISHILLQTSDNFTDTDIWDLDINNIAGVDTLQTWTSQLGNPGIPASIYGLKFEKGIGMADSPTWKVVFQSDRAPMWGNFYAKDGQTNQIDNTVYNTDFLITPSDRYSFDSVGYYVAVPDTKTTNTPAVPELATPLLAAMPLIGMLVRRRKR
jgi:hypothetical protein